MDIIKIYQDILEVIPDATYGIDIDGKVIIWNKAMEKITNVKKEDIIGKGDYIYSLIFYGKKRVTLADLVLNKDYKVGYNYYKNFKCNEDGSIEGEAHSEKMNYYDWGKASLLYDLNKNVIGAISISRDITEKEHYKRTIEEKNIKLKATVEQLIASESQLKAQYDSIQMYLGELEEIQQKYKIAIEGINSAIWEIDIKNKSLYISPEFAQLIGVDFKNKNVHEILDKSVHPDDKNVLLEEYKKYESNKKQRIYSQIRVIDKKGNIRWYLVNGKGVLDLQGNIKSISGILVDITQLKVQEKYIKFLSEHDHLTKLPNRRKMVKILKQELKSNKKGAVLLLDLDNFKVINDTLGHAYGDKVLIKVADILKDIENTIAFRMGGDEFLLLIKDTYNLQKIKKYADRLLNALKDMENGITGSVGIARYPYDANSLEDILIKVDIAMYNAKNSGKNKYIFFDEKMDMNFKGRLELENILREAIKNEGFTLLYHPIVNSQSGEIEYFESLLRLKEKKISPDIFIPLAEETNLISDIGKWAIKEAIIQIKKWKEKGYKSKPISVNISPKQLYDENLIKFIKDTLSTYKVDSSLLEIEITENVLIEDEGKVLKVLDGIKKLGVKISIDDFGRGYSSFNSLTFIPVDKIKIDKSITDEFLKLDIIENLISFSHALNLKVVVEGVENKEQYLKLKQYGCDYLQGYFFSKPLISEKIEKIYNNVY
ncbi:PAS domain S-box-containing protein/diguanylate cyclase (GGDEF) domain-containing protein [Alkalithermobacter thermoalcaliphilus JW-YL-7 = DSM 7308]|uniref:Diguanylate cyclase/phosphodiesterase with PAS/PAC sensor(S) n=1 Tax=Alkalithermobacter thermoalcaliphilus JW-YL-7 = DSM 7308 TaxID=1121328 RepID=A0A150FNP5_CLOPD|nr:diguanylate cyclase/phosphodiesterase with PAS/PAC sensor(s) [[Clostridium] paradoxum JW-YL-7 = DSM 7308]SHK85971.1 PAS domain S-box-containing protein/diguanylate cyclase (GGDEF) domain-containing protein [[Clostridium] paradoxum JW-YL-7 = DSM 7308]